MLDLNGFGENVHHLIFNGGDVSVPSPGSILPTGDITVNSNANSQAIISGRMSVLTSPIIDVTGHFFSPDLMIDALMFGAGGITKNGVGEVGLTAANTYSGQTTVSAGTLVVNGSQQQSPVTVNGTATLMGDGVIGNLQVFGSVAPGNSPAMLTCSNVAFAAQGDYFVELDGSTAGSGYDQLNVRGTNQLGGSTLHLSAGAGFAPVEGERLTILNNDGAEAIGGTFAGLPNGSLITAGGLQFRILYSDIFLNDVILVMTNTALKLAAAPVVSTGNGNGEIELGECNLICGTNIDLVLTVHTATNGSFSVPIRVFTGGAGTAPRFNRAGDQAIPDLGTLDSTIVVSGVTSPLHHLVVLFHLSHTVDDNLDIAHDPSNTNNVILKWSSSAIGFNLVATNALHTPPNAFTPIGPPPVVVNSKFTVTNAASGSGRFYQLRKP